MAPEGRNEASGEDENPQANAGGRNEVERGSNGREIVLRAFCITIDNKKSKNVAEGIDSIFAAMEIHHKEAKENPEWAILSKDGDLTADFGRPVISLGSRAYQAFYMPQDFGNGAFTRLQFQIKTCFNAEDFKSRNATLKKCFSKHRMGLFDGIPSKYSKRVGQILMTPKIADAELFKQVIIYDLIKNHYDKAKIPAFHLENGTVNETFTLENDQKETVRTNCVVVRSNEDDKQQVTELFQAWTKLKTRLCKGIFISMQTNSYQRDQLMKIMKGANNFQSKEVASLYSIIRCPLDVFKDDSTSESFRWLCSLTPNGVFRHKRFPSVWLIPVTKNEKEAFEKRVDNEWKNLASHPSLAEISKPSLEQARTGNRKPTETIDIDMGSFCESVWVNDNGSDPSAVTEPTKGYGPIKQAKSTSKNAQKANSNKKNAWNMKGLTPTRKTSSPDHSKASKTSNTMTVEDYESRASDMESRFTTAVASVQRDISGLRQQMDTVRQEQRESSRVQQAMFKVLTKFLNAEEVREINRSTGFEEENNESNTAQAVEETSNEEISAIPETTTEVMDTDSQPDGWDFDSTDGNLQGNDDQNSDKMEVEEEKTGVKNLTKSKTGETPDPKRARKQTKKKKAETQADKQQRDFMAKWIQNSGPNASFASDVDSIFNSEDESSVEAAFQQIQGKSSKKLGTNLAKTYYAPLEVTEQTSSHNRFAALEENDEEMTVATSGEGPEKKA